MKRTRRTPPSPPSPCSASSQNQLADLTQGGCIIDWENDEDHNRASLGRSITNLHMDPDDVEEDQDGDIDDDDKDMNDLDDSDNEERDDGHGKCVSPTNRNRLNSDSSNCSQSSGGENQESPFGAQPLTQEIFEQEHQQQERQRLERLQQKQRLKKSQRLKNRRRSMKKTVENEVEGMFAILDKEKHGLGSPTTSGSLSCSSNSQINSNGADGEGTSPSRNISNSINATSSASSSYSPSRSNQNTDHDDDMTVQINNLNNSQNSLNDAKNKLRNRNRTITTSSSSMDSVLKRRRRRIEHEQKKRKRSMEKKQRQRMNRTPKNATVSPKRHIMISNRVKDTVFDSKQKNSQHHSSNPLPKCNDLNKDSQDYGSSFADLLNDLDDDSDNDCNNNCDDNERNEKSISSEMKLDYDEPTSSKISSLVTVIDHQIPQHESTEPMDTDNHNEISNNNKVNVNSEEEFNDPFSGGINFNDEMIAAVDAAIHARTLSQQQQQKQQQQDSLQKQLSTDQMNADSNHTLSRSSTVQASNVSDVSNRSIESNPIQSYLLSTESVSKSQPSQLPQSLEVNDNNDDEYGDFPMMDFDELDKMVETRQNINMADPSIVTSTSSTPLPSPSTVDGQPEFMNWTRYVIKSIIDDVDKFQKILGVVLWTRTDENNFKDINEGIDNIQQQPQQEFHINGQIFLQGEWYHTRCEVGDIIHVCSLSGRYKTDITALPICLDTVEVNDDLLLIQHPDELITPTSISEAVSCSRLAVLKARLGSTAMTNKSAVIGQIRHDLFEKCLTNHDFSRKFVNEQAPRVVRDHAEQLIGCGIYDENQTIKEVVRIQPQLERFARSYTSFGTGEENYFNIGAELEGHGISSSINFVAKNVQDTEESTISTELGLRGFIDATVEARTKGCTVQRTIYGNEKPTSPQTALMGIELKTGHNQKPHMNHVAQLSLYSLTLRARHGTAREIDQGNCNTTNSLVSNGALKGGMLLYLNHQSLNAVHVSPEINEIKSLLSQRNMIATDIKIASKPRGVKIEYERNDSTFNHKKEAEMKKRISVHPATPTELPELLHSSHSCERCFVNRQCVLVAATGDLEPHSRKSHGPLLHHFTGHLNQEELQYFREWDRLIDLEAHTSNHSITKAWLIDSVERERSTGKCMSSLIVSDLGNQKHPLFEQYKGDEDAFNIKLERSVDSELNTPLNTLKFELGSRVVLSSNGNSIYRSGQKQDFSILRGTIKDIETNWVIIRVGEADAKRITRIKTTTPQNTHFRLEKDDFTAGVGTLRQNLMNLFTADIPPFTGKLGVTEELLSSIHERTKSRLPWLRRSIIHLNAPRFGDEGLGNIFHTSATRYIKGCCLKTLAKEFQGLNTDQKAAIRKVISAKDYALIQGFPGTGKTSTIAFLVRLLVARGKRILVSSYTHSAVDNLLLKLLKDGVGEGFNSDLVRIGAKNSCHPALQSLLAPEMACERDRVEGRQNATSKPSTMNLHRIISSAKIVGATALTVSKTPLLLGEHFDIVIVDEAGQISQPAILGPLMAADSFLLVGDHQQLPPLVQSEVAEKAGHGVSMLKRLADAFPYAVAQLTLQYRMHEDICLLSNLVVYKGKLKCVNDDVRSKKLLLPSFPRALKNICNGSSIGLGWLLPVLNPFKAVTFVNTDKIGSVGKSFRGLETSHNRSRHGGGAVNEVEAKLTRLIVDGLQICGLDSKSIGVVCPYRSQLQILENDPFLNTNKRAGLEVSTIDRYQGRDKEAIVLSFVRSNEIGRTGKLLEDFRRINVAFSRAKRKLIMIGSYRTLTEGSQVLQPVIKEIEKRKWMETIPPNALEVYKEPVC